MGKANFSLYKYNRRKLKIAIEKNCISKEVYSNIKTVLDDHLANETSCVFEEILTSFPLLLPIEDILPILQKEIFKYNQIIIKLAQQFAKNTTNQQFKLQKQDTFSINQANAQLNKVFLNILKDITNDYLSSRQRNIDDVLLESGFIQASQLEFLHNSAEHLEIKAQDRKFGEIAVKNEFTTDEIVQQALDEQTERYKKTSKNHIIGDILVEQNHITAETRDEILIIQNRVLEEDWEDTLKRVGQSSMEEKEKSALFGALILKERLLDEAKVVEALKIQAKELEDYRKKSEAIKNKINGAEDSETGDPKNKPRWIGDILVEDFGLSERDRKRIIKKQMEYKIERINLKFGLNLSNAHIELFNEMEQYFELSYSKNNIEAFIKVLKPIPKSMTKDNMIVWLYHKKIRYGRINNAIASLIANKVKPGKKILLAKGDEPVDAEVKYKFHFHTRPTNNNISQISSNHRDANQDSLQKNSLDSNKRENESVKPKDININKTMLDTQNGFNSGNIVKSIVLKGAKLITFQKIKGKSGLNVNRCFVAPPMIAQINIIKGENIIRNENEFVASCDGIPYFSEKRVLSVLSKVNIKGDLSQDHMAQSASSEFDCDFDIHGAITKGVSLGCRKLKVVSLMGKVAATDEVTVLRDTVNGELLSKGNISLSSVENSSITGEKLIVIKPHSYDNAPEFNRIYNSIITSDDIFRISDAKIISSVIRARNKVILKKVTVGEQCKFIVGDSIEVISYKKRIEELNSEIVKITSEIESLQKISRALFEKLEKKDISAIDQEIKTLSRNQRTKDDLDRIAELRVIKRQREREYAASIDQYSSTFMKNAQQIKHYQEQKSIFEKEKKEVGNSIMGIYKKEAEIPELDIRRTMLPAGTIIQFRYNQQVLSKDCEGFVFREEFNQQTHRYELKQHRW